MKITECGKEFNLEKHELCFDKIYKYIKNGSKRYCILGKYIDGAKEPHTVFINLVDNLVGNIEHIEPELRFKEIKIPLKIEE
jgi:hypothetical protein